MYSKEQASKIKQQFWTKFGQYMKPVPGADGNAVNWINYKTGIRGIFFRTDADKQKAIVAIEIRNMDDAERKKYYDQFYSLKKLLESETGFEWMWQENIAVENGHFISRISQTLDDVNLMNEADWPAIIAFIKPRITALGSFWQTVKDGFE